MRRLGQPVGHKFAHPLHARDAAFARGAAPLSFLAICFVTKITDHFLTPRTMADTFTTWYSSISFETIHVPTTGAAVEALLASALCANKATAPDTLSLILGQVAATTIHGPFSINILLASQCTALGVVDAMATTAAGGASK